MSVSPGCFILPPKHEMPTNLVQINCADGDDSALFRQSAIDDHDVVRKYTEKRTVDGTCVKNKEKL